MPQNDLVVRHGSPAMNEGALRQEGGKREVIDVDAGGHKVRSAFEFAPPSTSLTFALGMCHRRSQLEIKHSVLIRGHQSKYWSVLHF